MGILNVLMVWKRIRPRSEGWGEKRFETVRELSRTIKFVDDLSGVFGRVKY